MVLNAMEISVNVALVNSPFFILVMMLSLNLTNKVKVECFLLKSDCVSLYNWWFSINTTICFKTNFWYIFNNTGNTDVSLQLENNYYMQFLILFPF